MKIIKRNAVQCKLCDTVIESRSVHDYVSCICGHVQIYGGLDYLKRSGAGEYTELSEFEEVEDKVYEKEIGD